MRLLGAWLIVASAALASLSPASAQSTLTRAEFRGGLIPGSGITEVRPWSPGAGPTAAHGTQVAAFADALDHPRGLHVLPNGDVLVAETRAPPQRGHLPGLKVWRHGLLMMPTDEGGPFASRVVLLRDTDGDGVADLRSVLLQGLNSPFGMALVGDALFVATTDAVLRFPYSAGDTSITAAPSTVLELPAGPVNHHWAKNLIASPDGTRLYVSVGSNSNVGERGLAAEAGRAAIWEVDIRNGGHRVYASGLRNPNGLAWEPGTGSLWVVVVEREGAGGKPVPDYLTSVREGGFYGWPSRLEDGSLDERVELARPDRVAGAIAPDYPLGPFAAPVGLAWSGGARLPSPFLHGMFVGQQQGSRQAISAGGHKVVFVPFESGRPVGPPVDLLTGFLAQDGTARGRPVGVALDAHGALLVADDVGDVVWRVTAGR